jgi:SAM-dependent methyltransferase
MKRAWLLHQLRERYEHPEEVRAYTDQVAQGLTAEEAAAIKEYLPQPRRVANLGCGAGREAFALQDKGHQVVALDISRAMLRVARELAQERKVDIPFVWMPNALRFPLADESFDCAVALAQLLSHIPGKATRVGFLREVRRVLVPGGLLIASVTDREGAADLYGEDVDSEDAFSSLAYEAGWEEGDLWVWQPSEARLDTPLFFHLHTRREMEEELQAAGLQLVRYVGGHELTPYATSDAFRYRFVVARLSNP